ncbi:uncharacterized protein BBA_10329 [Beauveria bassiana ARSEF 2860]|uniref:Uncharacterized protein n=1 Tax=Beauveria bassiana (strain ARSEF 2860) TaxID=655819 RepID=J4KKM7_BEAB2|nr:uncharacterized protein BBA_10329 [Beauveria bassiana ARSEF 2860]EJP60724.1 hypothetical protein BBA_10329 [Beauveria bassiana ARSEF 2860]
MSTVTPYASSAILAFAYRSRLGSQFFYEYSRQVFRFNSALVAVNANVLLRPYLNT